MKLDFYVVPLILVDTLNAVEGAGLNVRPTNEQLQLNSKQTQSIWRIYLQMLLLKMERNNDMNIATYQATPEKHGNGTFFFTDCGHNMYSVRDDMAYHGCLCPACFSKGIQTILYIRGSKEANEYWDNKLKKRK